MSEATLVERPLAGPAPLNPTRLYVIFAFITTLVDTLMTVAALFGAYYVRFHMGLGYQQFHAWQEYVGLAALQAVVYPVTFMLRGHYHPRRAAPLLDELQKVFVGASISSVISMALGTFLLRDQDLSRGLILVDWGLGISLLWLGRLLVGEAARTTALLLNAETRVVVVGTGELARDVWLKLRRSASSGYRTLGLVSPVDDPTLLANGTGVPCLGAISALATIIQAHGVEEVVVADPTLSRDQLLDVLAICDRRRVTLRVFPDVFQIISSEATIDEVNGLPFLNVRDAALRGWNLAIKRFVDVVLSFVLLLFLSPLMLSISLLIKLTSGNGPVFYIQERVGRDGRFFPCIKFRSMRTDAEARTGPVWTSRGDPRVTRLGAILRRFSLDELPQFINVLRGEMSIVGPRPERPHFVDQFSQWVPRYGDRHREKAGLTGWAQVNGLRGNVSIEERTAYDLWYVEHWSLWLDFKIMLRTIVSIFGDRNAY